MKLRLGHSQKEYRYLAAFPSDTTTPSIKSVAPVDVRSMSNPAEVMHPTDSRLACSLGMYDVSRRVMSSGWRIELACMGRR